MSFFLPGDAPDVEYRNIRSAEFPNERDARAFIEALWEDAAPFLDTDVQASAPRDFLARFWEMYVATALLKRPLTLVQTRQRNLRLGGPDLLVKEPRAFVECVAARAGTGVDAVERPVPFVVTYVPRERIILRIRAAISEKLTKYNQYRAKGVLADSDPYVIAVNGAGIPMARGEPTLPYVVQAVLPFGRQQFHLDEAFQIVGTSFQQEFKILKVSGSPVATDVFLSDDHAGVSAVVYGCVDAANHADVPGSEFIIVHNPRARNPLPRNLFPHLFEFWVEEDHLHVSAAGAR